MKTILIWDLDNLSTKNKIEEVYSKLLFQPTAAYGVSKKSNMKITKILKLKSYGIDFIKIGKRSDIENLLKGTLDQTDNYIIISSDSMFCEFTKIATEQNKQIQQFLISTKQKRTLFKNDLTANNVKYFFLEECKKNKINITKNKAVEKVDYFQLSNAEVIKRMYAEKNREIDYCQLSNTEITKRMKAENIFYSKYAIRIYREQKNKEQEIKPKIEREREKVKGSSSKISLFDLEDLYKTTSLLKKELKTKKTTGASK